jgi:hypothetical protein
VKIPSFPIEKLVKTTCKCAACEKEAYEVRRTKKNELWDIVPFHQDEEGGPLTFASEFFTTKERTSLQSTKRTSAAKGTCAIESAIEDEKC